MRLLEFQASAHYAISAGIACSEAHVTTKASSRTFKEEVMQRELMSVREFAEFVNLSPTTVYAAAYADHFATSIEMSRMKVCVADSLRWVGTLSPKTRARQRGAKP